MAWMLHMPPSAISPTICSCADGHSLRTALLNLIWKSPEYSPVLTKGLGPSSYLSFHCATRAFRLKSLNMHMCPWSIIFLRNLKTRSLPSWKVQLEYPPQHSQLKTTQSGSTALTEAINLMAVSSLGFPSNALSKSLRYPESQAYTSTLVPSMDFCSTVVKSESQLPPAQKVTITATTFLPLSSSFQFSNRMAPPYNFPTETLLFMLSKYCMFSCCI